VTQTREKDPRAMMASSKSAGRSTEHEQSSPPSPSDIIRKSASEAGGEHGVGNKVEAVGRELNRNIGGEYARRDDETPPRVQAESSSDEAPLKVVRGADGNRHLVSRLSRTKWLVVAALLVLICVIALVAFVALRANATQPGQGDRQYTISPVQPNNQ